MGLVHPGSMKLLQLLYTQLIQQQHLMATSLQICSADDAVERLACLLPVHHSDL